MGETLNSYQICNMQTLSRKSMDQGNVALSIHSQQTQKQRQHQKTNTDSTDAHGSSRMNLRKVPSTHSTVPQIFESQTPFTSFLI